LLGWAAEGYAFEVQYGNFFTIARVRVKQDTLVLPLTRGKYQDVRILDKATFNYVKNCAGLSEQEVCLQNIENISWRVGDILPVPAPVGKYIVSVIFNEAWLVQAVAEQIGAEFRITFPSAFAFIRPAGCAPKKKAPTIFEEQVTDFIKQQLEGMQQK